MNEISVSQDNLMRSKEVKQETDAESRIEDIIDDYVSI